MPLRPFAPRHKRRNLLDLAFQLVHIYVVNKKYCLVLAAIPKNDYYSAGWLAGSVIAHKIHSQLAGKAFWVCPLKYVGIRNNDKEQIKEQGKLGDHLESYGYFYDGNDGAVSWLFDIVGIYKNNELHSLDNKKLAELDRYMGFRKIYFDDKNADGYFWILIKNIRRLRKPYAKQEIKKGTYKIPSFRRITSTKPRNIITHDFMQGGAVFASEYPRESSVIDYDPSTITDMYLKELLLSKSGSSRLKESAVQMAFALKLMQDNNWSLVMEKHLMSNRRIDLLFNKGKDLVVVEIKRSDNDNPVFQLKRYIHELNKCKEYQGKKIHGIVLCGKSNNETEKAAKKEGFKVLPYTLSMNIPKLHF